jgi:hypothetical protein
MKRSAQSDTPLQCHKNNTYRRTAVHCETLNQIIRTAVSAQTEQSDTKRQGMWNLIFSVSLKKNGEHFQNNNEFYKQSKVLAIGSMISRLIAKVFLLYYEHLIIKHDIDKKNQLDEILVIYDHKSHSHTDIKISQLNHQ